MKLSKQGAQTETSEKTIRSVGEGKEQTSK